MWIRELSITEPKLQVRLILLKISVCDFLVAKIPQQFIFSITDIWHQHPGDYVQEPLQPGNHLSSHRHRSLWWVGSLVLLSDTLSGISGNALLGAADTTEIFFLHVACAGSISFEEFRQTWRLLCSHLKTEISDEAIADLAHSIDFNKDGSIDINEFMEAFRLVDLSAHAWEPGPEAGTVAADLSSTENIKNSVEIQDGQ